MSDIVDDKTQHCAPFILERLAAHRREHARLSGNTPPPFFLGLNGVQGAGKTTLVSTLCSTLRSPPHNTPTLVFSIDDLYLTHDAQVALAAAHQDNELIQHRGQPGTHDVDLALSIFYSLYHRLPTAIPAYDKAAYDGQGERTDPATWVEVNRPDQQPIEVVIFEGWCVAFRSLDEAELRFRWEAARRERDGLSRIWRHDFNHLSFVNDALRAYDGLTDKLDALIHIDAQDPQYVYQWRLDQEVALRMAKGSGMTNSQVRRFVDGYYPSYELYTDTLRQGAIRRPIADGDTGRLQLHIVVGQDRRVVMIERIKQ